MGFYLGAAVYIDIARASDCVDFIEQFLVETSDTGKPVRFPYCQTVGTPNLLRITKESKITRVDQPKVQEMHQLLLTKNVTQVKYLSDRTSDICAHVSFVAISIDDSYQLLVRIALPKSIADTPVIVEWAKGLTQKCGCKYGHIESGPCLYVDSLLQMWPIGWHGGRQESAEWISELEYLWDRRDEFGEMIPRVAWGNILSPSHIAKLGGVERIRRESGVFLVDDWNDNIYIQLSASPWCFGLSDLLELDRFLRPARLSYDWQPLFWAANVSR